MCIKLRLILLLIILIVVPAMASADTRSLSMGGTFTAVGGDSSAQGLNPAGLYGSGEKTIHIIDLTLTGEMVDLYDNLLVISSAMAKAKELEGTGEFFNYEMLNNFSEGMQAVEYVGESGTGVMTDMSLGSIQISLGNPAISINPHIYLGVSPMMDMGLLTSGDLKITTGTMNLDFTLIPASTDTPAGTLIAARDNLIPLVDTLVRAGAYAGSRTYEEVANSIVNQIKSEGIEDAQIELLTSDTNSLIPLFESLYVLFTSTAPENYLDYEIGFIIKDLNTAEVSVGYSLQPGFLRGTFLEELVIGANLKYIFGEAAYKRLNIDEIGHMQDEGYVMMKPENKCQSYSFGLDIGFLYDKRQDWNTKFALSLTNVNRPTFKAPPSAEGYDEVFEIAPAGKLGVAFWPLKNVVLAADVDVIKTATFLENLYYQMMSLGAEVYLLDKLPDYRVALRCGYKKNMAASYDSSQYSMGLGLTLMSVTLDLGFAFSPYGNPIEQASGDIASTLTRLGFSYFPKNWELGVGLSFKFGGNKPPEEIASAPVNMAPPAAAKDAKKNAKNKGGQYNAGGYGYYYMPFYMPYETYEEEE